MSQPQPQLQPKPNLQPQQPLQQPRDIAGSVFVSGSSVPSRQVTILAVDDDRVALLLLTEALKSNGYAVITSPSGDDAMNKLATAPDSIDAIILDREMPGLSGLQVMTKLKADPVLSGIPVIMLTGSGSAEDIQEGIEAGVFYYLVKPANEVVLKSIVSSALRERQQKRALITELSRHEAALRAMRHSQIDVRTLAEAEDTACFLASCFPQPERVVAGLMELLVNAVEHGNLGITYEEKSKLLSENQWRDDIRRRLSLSENANKSATVIYQRKDDGWFVQITDQGSGFDWKRYWQIDPTRATASHGRGIARARLMAFDQLAYNDIGNQVTVMVSAHSSKPLEW